MSINLDSLFPACGKSTDPAGVSQEVSQEVAQAVSSRSPMTFRQAMDKARAQIDLKQFYGIDLIKSKDGQLVLYRTQQSDIAESLMMAMAEVYKAHPEKVFYVGREEKTAEEIAYIYEHIDTEMMYTLVERLKNEVGGSPIKYQRPYLRTMLYNEVFEAAIKETARTNNIKW